MRQRNEAEAGFLALRQGYFFPDGGVFPCQLQRGGEEALSTESCIGTSSGWLGFKPCRSASRSSTSFPLFT